MKKHILLQIVSALGILLSQPIVDATQAASTCTMNGMGGSQPKEVCLLTKFLETLRKTGIHKHGHNILLFVGKKGTGKKMCAEKIAQNSGATYEKHSAKELAAQGIKGTRLVNKIFDSTKNLKQPHIIIIDDLDRIDHKKHILLISVLNSNLQSAFENENLIVIMTVRNTRSLDDALKNRCHTIFWELPDQEDRLDLFKFFLRGKAHGLNQKALINAAKQTKHFSAEDIQKTIAIANYFKEVDDFTYILPQQLNIAIREKRSMIAEDKTKAQVAVVGGILFISIIAGIITYKIADKLYVFDSSKKQNKNNTSVKKEVENR